MRKIFLGLAIISIISLTGCTLLGGLTDEQKTTFKNATSGISTENSLTVTVEDDIDTFSYKIDGDDMLMEGTIEGEATKVGYINNQNYGWVEGDCVIIPSSEADFGDWQDETGMDFNYTDEDIDSAVTYDGEESVDGVEANKYTVTVEGDGEEVYWISKADDKVLKLEGTYPDADDVKITFDYEKPTITAPTGCIQ